MKKHLPNRVTVDQYWEAWALIADMTNVEEEEPGKYTLQELFDIFQDDIYQQTVRYLAYLAVLDTVGFDLASIDKDEDMATKKKMFLDAVSKHGKVTEEELDQAGGLLWGKYLEKFDKKRG